MGAVNCLMESSTLRGQRPQFEMSCWRKGAGELESGGQSGAWEANEEGGAVVRHDQSMIKHGARC